MEETENKFRLTLYTKHIPTYAAVQWNGKNLLEMKRFLGRSAVITEDVDLLSGNTRYGLYILKSKDPRIHFRGDTFYNPTMYDTTVEMHDPRSMRFISTNPCLDEPWEQDRKSSILVPYGWYVVMSDEGDTIELKVIEPQKFEMMYDVKGTIIVKLPEKKKEESDNLTGEENE